MNFDTFLQTAWNDHGNNPGDVADRLLTAGGLVESPTQIPRLAALVAHVYGEHLGRSDDGVRLLESLRELQVYAGNEGAATSVARNIATLRYVAGADVPLDAFAAPERVAILATASSAFATRCEFKRAIDAYRAAVVAGAAGLEEGSPAFRSLAVGGNNLAAALEEKRDRDEAETAGMVFAAEGGLTYWKLAGTWLEEERAEYRLTRSLLEAGDPARARAAAERCIAGCERNDAPPFECFFGHAALSLAQRAFGDETAAAAQREAALAMYERIPEDERVWCAGDLRELGG